jgi:hypothetical protein
MSEHPLELRLQAAARSLDSVAPAFDPSVLRDARRPVLRRRVVGIAAALAVVGALAPAAFSGLNELFGVDEVEDLGPVPADVVGPLPLLQARSITLDELAKVPFAVHMLSSEGRPTAAYTRDDIAGGMVTLVYGDRLLLTQWPDKRIDTRVTIVPTSGTAETVKIGSLPGLWIEGTARGIFTLIGADGTTHKERFEVEKGALLWKQDGVALLLQGAGTKEKASKIAAESIG